MYKIINLAGRISLFFVIEVAMYYAMIDPLLRIIFGLPDRPALLIASWALLIVAAIIDATILPVSITTRAPMPTSNKLWR